MGDKVSVERDGDIAIVSLDNPGRLNALTLSMWRELGAAMNALSDEVSVRCVVLRGAGTQAFAAGADINEFSTCRANREQAQAYAEVTTSAMTAIEQCRHPVVAMVYGVCVGGGLEIASLCDIRICGESSRFGAPVGRLGLTMSYGELAALIRLVGRSVAMEIVLEGRIFDAPASLANGIVSRVVPDSEVEREAISTARRIAHGAPLVARWHKHAANRLTRSPELSRVEIESALDCFDTEDFRIGAEAFSAKQKPIFKGK
ncbi:Short-chain-enoyl-CoA hydratase [Pandoraea eparura]|jgi:enoyl-CoA hydratase/carnithine racemase|uniref:Short-chain-enoyl-CoA hydratase n=1 Tax=Pandoraea eparura TaxID=2508291 RepID=A0A5E4VXJ7_9BURK|nr:enoyl-CoA hydratase-related protein [Pandoraea eparura]VVE15585.1 Short-chain-enoyl-CoA hydratase [Pandoraea eparura]